MKTTTSEPHLLPDAKSSSARFRVPVTFEASEAADATLESAAAHDSGDDDFLSPEEVPGA